MVLVTALFDDASNIDPLIGHVLDQRIEILSVLGRGAAGTVYKGYHQTLDKTVAVKVLNQQVLEPNNKSKERFFSEAQVLGTMAHENIVKFYSFGECDDGRYYMVLELLNGLPLSQILKESTALNCNRAISIFIQLCAGLSYAHSKGVIHRDIKPDNVMICSNSEGTAEEAKLLDFGISKVIESAGKQDLTQTGIMLGSVNYMSPEQCTNQPLDQRTDIYSLGCLIYECLVGEPPMQDVNDMMIMSKHVNTNLTTVPSKFPIPARLQAAVLRCLDKKPEQRFSNADELMQVLQECRKDDISKENSGSFRIWTFVIVSALILAVVCRGFFDVRFKNASQNAIRFKPLALGPPPDQVASEADLICSEEWLAKAFEKGQTVDLITLANVYIKCAQFRNSKSMKFSTLPAAEIEHRLSAFKFKNTARYQDRMKLKILLAHVCSWAGDDALALESLDELAKPAAANEGWREAEFCALVQDMILSQRLQGRVEQEERLLQKLGRYVAMNKHPLAKAIVETELAKKAISEKNKEKAKEHAKSSYQIQLELAKNKSEDPRALNDLFDVLQQVDEPRLLLNLADSMFGRLDSADGTLTPHLETVKMRVAEAYYSLAEYKAAMTTANSLVKQCLEQHVDSKISNKSEGIALQAQSHLSPGMLCANAISYVSALHSSLSESRALQGGERMHEYVEAIAQISQQLAVLDQSQAQCFWSELEKTFPNLSRNYPEFVVALRMHQLHFLESSPGNNRAAIFALMNKLYKSVDSAVREPNLYIDICCRYACVANDNGWKKDSQIALNKAEKKLAGSSEDRKFLVENAKTFIYLRPEQRTEMLAALQGFEKRFLTANISAFENYPNCLFSLADRYRNLGEYRSSLDLMDRALEKVKLAKVGPAAELQILEHIEALCKQQHYQAREQSCKTQIAAIKGLLNRSQKQRP